MIMELEERPEYSGGMGIFRAYGVFTNGICAVS